MYLANSMSEKLPSGTYNSIKKKCSDISRTAFDSTEALSKPWISLSSMRYYLLTVWYHILYRGWKSILIDKIHPYYLALVSPTFIHVTLRKNTLKKKYILKRTIFKCTILHIWVWLYHVLLQLTASNDWWNLRLHLDSTILT
jgi:hypothetical protein